MAAWGVLPNRSGHTAYILLDILVTIGIRDVDDYYRVDVCCEDITTTTNLRKKDVFYMKIVVHIFLKAFTEDEKISGKIRWEILPGGFYRTFGKFHWHKS